MSSDSDRALSGTELVAEFQAVMINEVGVSVSAAEAAQSEKLATDALRYFSQVDILNPTLIPSDSNNQIARASVDAHIKKIQAAQYESLGKEQLAQMQSNATRYIHKPVTIRVLERSKKPIESVWFSKQKGYYTGVVNTNSLKGVIEEIWFDKNAILLKPRTVSRMFEPARKNYIVYVIDPATLQPMIEIELT